MKCKLCHDTGWQERGRALFLCDCDAGQYRKNIGGKSYNDQPAEVCEWTSSDINQWSYGKCGGNTTGKIFDWKVCPYCSRKLVAKE